MVGVLALQGDVGEHLRAVEATGGRAARVRTPADLAGVDALVLPGGESTAIDRLARVFDLHSVVAERIGAGMPAYGSCAGMILLADRLVDGVAGQRTFGGLDVAVRRNAFGRQVASFEEDLDVPALAEAGLGDGPVRAVFIRAPWVERAGDGTEVLARVSSEPVSGAVVAVRSGPLLATSFHPEVTGDLRFHRLFLQMVAAA